MLSHMLPGLVPERIKKKLWVPQEVMIGDNAQSRAEPGTTGQPSSGELPFGGHRHSRHMVSTCCRTLFCLISAGGSTSHMKY